MLKNGKIVKSGRPGDGKSERKKGYDVKGLLQCGNGERIKFLSAIFLTTKTQRENTVYTEKKYSRVDQLSVLRAFSAPSVVEFCYRIDKLSVLCVISAPSVVKNRALIAPKKRKQNKRGSNYNNINGHQHAYIAITYAALQAIHSRLAKSYEYQNYRDDYGET